MYIVHDMLRKVPHNISLHTRADLAHLVNYYNLRKAVEPFSDTWVTWTKQKLPLESYDPDVVKSYFASFSSLGCLERLGS
jgi:hypothetical protein